MIHFTADTHYNHANIIKYCNRPFKTVQEMNDCMVDKTNQIIQPNDTLWHLGDLAWLHPEEILDKINCRHINLVFGNHDIRIKQRLSQLEKQKRITIYKGFVDLKINGQKITLCHYPMLSWNCSYHGSWHLFGHVHGRNCGAGPNSYDVGVDNNRFAPISLEEINDHFK